MSKPILLFVALLVSVIAAAQEQKTDPAQAKPQVRLNYLNVCTPSPEEQAVLKGALSRVPAKPVFIEDFEVSRGRVTLKDAPSSKYVRLRREFSSESPLMVAQYSMSRDEQSTVEVLVLRYRDPKEFHEISLEDHVSSEAAAPVAVAAADTPVARMRVERLGKSSVVLTRCPEGDQSAYEAFFKQASDIMAMYRKTLGLRTTFRSDFTWLAGAKKPPAPGPALPSPHKP